MLGEKIKELMKNDGNNKKKIENTIFLIIILIVTIVIINFILKGEKTSIKQENDGNTYKTLAGVSTTEENHTSDNNLQRQLETILGTIKGVGKVSVFISYSESSKTVAMYDEKTTTSSTEETDSSRRIKKHYIYSNTKRCNIFWKRWKSSPNDRENSYAYYRRGCNYSNWCKKC